LKIKFPGYVSKETFHNRRKSEIPKSEYSTYQKALASTRSQMSNYQTKEEVEDSFFEVFGKGDNWSMHNKNGRIFHIKKDWTKCYTEHANKVY